MQIASSSGIIPSSFFGTPCDSREMHTGASVPSVIVARRSACAIYTEVLEVFYLILPGRHRRAGRSIWRCGAAASQQRMRGWVPGTSQCSRMAVLHLQAPG